MIAATVASGIASYGMAAGGQTHVLADRLPPLGWHAVFAQWEFAPVVTACVAVAATLYLVGVRQVRRRHRARPWPAWRTGCFMAGLLALVIATQSSVGAYDDVLFYMHMWQHLLLILVAPALLLGGQPLTLLLHASRNPVHAWVVRVVRSKAASGLTYPLVGLALYILCVAGTHLTSFMNLTLEYPIVHDSEHVIYLVVGYLYFLPLIGREPIRWKLSYPAKLFFLVLAMPVDTFTGVVLMQANHEMFPAYAGRRDWGPSLVNDLHAGGAVMWIGGDGLMFLIIMVVFARVNRSRVQIDAGGWIEGVRARRFAELAGIGTAAAGTAGVRRAASESTASAQTASRATVPKSTRSAPHGVDDDAERQLDAYNAYLARLSGGHGSPTGSAQ